MKYLIQSIRRKNVKFTVMGETIEKIKKEASKIITEQYLYYNDVLPITFKKIK